MININKNNPRNMDLFEYFGKVSSVKINNSRDFVFENDDKKIIFGFHTEDNLQSVIIADELSCTLITEDEKLLDFANKIDEANGRDSMLKLLLSYSADDIYELEDLETRIVDMEEELFNGVHADKIGLNRIVKCRKELMFKKQYYERMELLTDELADLDNRFIFIDRRFDKLYSFILRLQEYLTHVSEMYQAQIDIEQNNLMKFFTVVTTIFAPLTLIVGWYGMNLKMPEFHWRFGYVYVILLSIVAIFGMIYWFKKKKIL